MPEIKEVPRKRAAEAGTQGRDGQREVRLLQAKQEAVATKRKEIKEGLPHLYGYKWYAWARAFFECTHQMGLLVAANQISKSSTQIRTCIDWATNLKRQKRLWKTPPRVFWYLYPSKDVATVEFEKKWEPEFLPRAKFKNHPVYGWRAEYSRDKKIHAIHFNSGVTIYFKTYNQDAQDLQTGTVHAVFCDEELPEELYDELQFRLTAVDGFFRMVFTATLNQDMWKRALEGKGEAELFPEAFKQQISMYECLAYDDGSETPWTVEKIEAIKRRCKNRTEVLRRVYGRFVTESGRKYGAFDPTRHYRARFELHASWRVYVAVDGGSGGETGHPAAILFLAVSPDMRKGVVFRLWRGDGEVTTAGDIFEKYIELKGRLQPVGACYDQSAKDFGTIAIRNGEPFVIANKSHAIGEDHVNTLFKNNMLDVIDNEDGRKLGWELSSVMKATPKTKAKDDLADTLRYAVTMVNWDWTALSHDPEETPEGEEAPRPKQRKPLTEAELLALEIEERRGVFGKAHQRSGEDDPGREFEDQIAEWNDAMGS